MPTREYIATAAIRTGDFFKTIEKINDSVGRLDDKIVTVKVNYDVEKFNLEKLTALKEHQINLKELFSKGDAASVTKELNAMLQEIQTSLDAGISSGALKDYFAEILRAANSFESAFGKKVNNKLGQRISSLNDNFRINQNKFAKDYFVTIDNKIAETEKSLISARSKVAELNAEVNQLSSDKANVRDASFIMTVDLDKASVEEVREVIDTIRDSDPVVAVQLQYDYDENALNKLLNDQQYYNKLLEHRNKLNSLSNFKNKDVAIKDAEKELSLMLDDIKAGIEKHAPTDYLQELYRDIFNALNSFDIQFGRDANDDIYTAFDAFEQIPIFETLEMDSTDVNYFYDLSESIKATEDRIKELRTEASRLQDELAKLRAEQDSLSPEEPKHNADDKGHTEEKQTQKTEYNDAELEELEQRAQRLASEIGAAYDTYKAKLGEIPAEYEPIITKTDELIANIKRISRHNFGVNRVRRLNEALGETVSKIRQIPDGVMSGNKTAVIDDSNFDDDYDDDNVKHGRLIKSNNQTSYSELAKRELRETISVSEKLLNVIRKNNPIYELANFWNENDEILFKAAQDPRIDFEKENILERKAIIGTDGRLYGAGTYHQHKKNGMGRFIELPDGVSPLIDAHSHNYKKIASASIANVKDDGTIGGDLLTWAKQASEGAIKYAMVVARQGIQLFDADSFFNKAAKNIDFTSNDVKSILAVNKYARNDFIKEHALYAINEMADVYSSNGFQNGIAGLLEKHGMNINPALVADSFLDIIQNEVLFDQDLSGVLKRAINNVSKGTKRIKISDEEIMDAFGLSEFDGEDIIEFQRQYLFPHLFDGSLLKYLSDNSREELEANGINVNKYYKSLGIKDASDYMEYIPKNKLQEPDKLGLIDSLDYDATSFENTLSRIAGSLGIIDKYLTSIAQKKISNIFPGKNDTGYDENFDDDDISSFVDKSIQKAKASTDLFASLQTMASKIRFGKNGTSAADQLVEQYKEYISGGGTESYESLGGSKKLQAYLKQQLASTTEATTATEELTQAEKESVEASDQAEQNLVPLVEALTKLAEAAGASGDAIKSINTLISTVNKKTGDERIEKTVSALTDIYNVLKQEVPANSFITALENIAATGDNLPAMAEILTKTKRQIQNASSAINNKSDGNKTDSQKLSEIKGIFAYAKKERAAYYKASTNRDNNSDDAAVAQYYEENVAKARTMVDELRQSTTASKEVVAEAEQELRRYIDGQNDYVASYLQQAQTVQNRIQTLLAKGNLGATKTEEFQKQQAAIQKVIDELKRYPSGEYWENDTEALNKHIAVINNAKEILGEYISESDKLAKNAGVSNLRTLAGDLLANTSISGNLKKQLQNIYDELTNSITATDDLNNSFSKMSQTRLSNLSAQVKDIKDQLNQSGDASKKFGSRFSEALSNQAAQWLARFFSFQDLIRYGKQISQTVISVDSALTELRKVSDASNTRLQQSFQKSAQTAQELGATITDVINSTSDWARLGYSVDQAEELARVTTLYQTVGDNMTQESATQSLVSTLQGYKLDYTQAERVVDSINEVSNNFAIDTAGIGDALQRSAAAFAASGTDLNKSIALVTTANAVVQDPSSVGTIFKTLSARIRGQWWPIHNESCGPRCVIFAA